MTSDGSRIILIGNDAAFQYLMGRYAEQGGFELALFSSAPSGKEACDLKPIAILFSSIAELDAARLLVKDLTNCDIPVLVYASSADETRALEIGADRCLTQPLTYEGFLRDLQFN
jgi:CheY-like chemotaxis protein